VNDISDHFPIVAIISEKIKKIQENEIYPFVRDFRKFSNDSFQNSLRDFSDDDSLDIDTRMVNFHNHMLSCINHHIPLRSKTKKEKKFSLKPWISNSLKRSITKRKELYTLSRENHPDQSARKRNYNKYKKKLEKTLFAAQCNYFSNKIRQCQNQSKALWKIVNEITQRKKKTISFIQKLSLGNGRVIENSKDIANELNKYFVEVGPNLADQLPSCDTPFENYLTSNTSPSESFVLNPTCPDEVHKVIESFSNSSCEGPDKMSPKLYKLCSDSISHTLSRMVNTCFATC